MTPKEKRGWLAVLAFILFVIINKQMIYNMPSLNLYYHIIRPLVCGIIIYFFFKQSRPILDVSLKYRYVLVTFMVIIAILYVITYFMLGFIDGFGKNPFNTTPRGIGLNLLTFIPFFLTLECFRSIMVHSIPKKRRYLIMTVCVIIFTLAEFRVSDFTGLLTGTLQSNVQFIGSELMPEISKNIFLVNTSLLGGVWMSFMMKFAFEGMIFFFPVLPNLKWITSALLGNLYPVLSLTFLKNAIFTRDNRDRRPRVTSHTLSWSLTYLTGIAVVWFAVGLFPIFPTVILTGSMEPVMYPGDVAIMQKVDKENIQIGDVIQFWANDYFIIHRVVQIEDGKYITKGDNNNTEDSKPVEFGQVKGKMIYSVKYLGTPALLMRTKTQETLEDQVEEEYELGRD
ncbi:signal peptidase I [Acidaminobacter sp. JC074]|uniref:signal peptidase I n=1 Tax=Acidaminobacter sp. JC074 TaxID=2530199 RepID=UPI001F0EDDCC|nr:signal peptidase I [Acidaminobacter sp. JC074]MCH4890307.1 signal peptidase I [Acidaminobacter sp. JC074]